MPDKSINYLILTSSGGSGLILAAKAKREKILKEDPKANVIIVDVLKQWIFKFIGNLASGCWNNSQKKGFVKIQELLFHCQKVAEYLFWPFFYFRALRILKKEKIDFLFDTQVLGVQPIVKAIKKYNRLSGKNILLEKIVVDLPTKKCTHFLHGFRKLSLDEKKLVKIITLEPLLEKDQTEEIFWQEMASMRLDQIAYEKYSIRPSFLKYLNRKQTKSSFSINLTLLDKLVEKKVLKLAANAKNSEFKFTIAPNDFLITILLGSHPSLDGTYQYVEEAVKIAKSLKRNLWLVVFCGTEKDPLFNKIARLLQNRRHSRKLHVITVPFQSQENVAGLFFRSNLTVTRVGGQTAMELMAVAQGQICIHSERSHTQEYKRLLKGIPVWESGNAEYMVEKFNAKVINPGIFSSIVNDLIIGQKRD